MKKKQYTGKPGRPRNVNIEGGQPSEPLPVTRLSAHGRGEPSSIEIGGVPTRVARVGGVEILSASSKQSNPETKQDKR